MFNCLIISTFLSNSSALVYLTSTIASRTLDAWSPTVLDGPDKARNHRTINISLDQEKVLSGILAHASPRVVLGSHYAKANEAVISLDNLGL